MSLSLSAETLLLLYPLGYLSNLAFGLRFMVQWLYSETQGKSLVVRPFWWLSLVGNLLLFIHSMIQMQLPVSLMQAVNGVISWRNLNLMGPAAQKWRLSSTLALMGALSAGTLILYGLFLPYWFRVPDPALSVSWGWHLIGFIGICLFSSRFIVQWWEAEKAKESVLGAPFWWMSLTGGLLSAAYFSVINDPVNLIGPLLGMIPYVRNLMLLRRA